MNKSDVTKTIEDVLYEINTQLPQENRINIDSDDCIANFDSLQLINFIVALEEKIEENFNKVIIFSLELNDSKDSFLESKSSLTKHILKNLM